jgi:hypothetical protein
VVLSVLLAFLVATRVPLRAGRPSRWLTEARYAGTALRSFMTSIPYFRGHFGRDDPGRRRSTRLRRVRMGFGSDFAEEPAVQGVEPVTQATSRSRLSSRTPLSGVEDQLAVHRVGDMTLE